MNKSSLPSIIRLALRPLFNGVNRALWVDRVLRDSEISRTELIGIAGIPRSGTTLLSAILNRNPDCFAPAEYSHLIKERFDARKMSEECAYFGVTRFKLMEMIDRLGWSKTLDQLFERALSQSGKSRFVTKCPEYTFWLSRILESFPNSRWILACRDGRDGALSILENLVESQTVSFTDAVNIWRRYANGIISNRDRGECLIVRYEDLVEQPQKSIIAIAAHLKIDFDPKMLSHEEQDFTNNLDARAPHHSNLQKSISTGSINRWKGRLSDDQEELFWKIAGKEMNALGYTRSSSA